MGIRAIFHNGRELRSGWRLLLFLLLVVAFYIAARKGLEPLTLPEGFHPVSFIVGDAAFLAVALVATAIMAHFEHRSLTRAGSVFW